MSDIIVCLQ